MTQKKCRSPKENDTVRQVKCLSSASIHNEFTLSHLLSKAIYVVIIGKPKRFVK
ncbi:MAG: hypothetical protein ACI4QU_01035 [Christensenellales bacterium]